MIQRKAFAPELEKRIRHHLRLTNDPYRVDESCVKIKGKSCDLLSVWRQKV
jgi:transposase-like protein